MSAINEHVKDCLRQAINTLLENGRYQPALTRAIIRDEMERALDEQCGKAQEHDGRFTRYLKKQSESCLWNSPGDEEHDGNYYKAGAASCFFPVAAKELVKDGIEARHIALFCIEGAMTALRCDGTSLEEAKKKLMQIVLRNQLAEDLHPESRN